MTSTKRFPLWLRLACYSLRLVSVRADERGTPRETVSLDGSGWKLVGVKSGEGERLGIFRHPSERFPFIRVSVPSDVQSCVGLKDLYGQDPEIIDINRKEWWYVRAFRRARRWGVVAPAGRERGSDVPNQSHGRYALHHFAAGSPMHTAAVDLF